MTAENGKQGLEIIQSGKKNVDLIILDLSMPEMSGFEFLDHFSHQHASAKILISTGRSEEELMSLYQNEQFEFIKKPFTVEEIVDKVLKILRLQPHLPNFFQ